MPQTRQAQCAPIGQAAFVTPTGSSLRHCSMHRQADGQISTSSAPPPWVSPPSLQKGLQQDGSADH